MIDWGSVSLVVLGWLLGLIFQEFHAMFIRSTTLLIALSALASPSLADIHFQTNVLDAYQHQKATQNNTPAGRPAGASYDSGDWWQPTGGWCSNGAWVGAMHRAEYSLGAGNLFSRGNAAEPNWVRQMNYNMEDISIFASRGMPAQPAPLAVNSANAQCISPGDMQSYFTLAAIHYSMGNPSKAIAILEEAKRVSPSVAAQADPVIESIKNGTAVVQ